MKIVWNQQIYKWKFLEMELLEVEKEDWKTTKRESVKRINSQPVVSSLVENITNNTFVLVEQFRAPVNKRVIELVAWVCDKPWYTSEQIIREEIMEETWYNAKKIELLLRNAPKSPWMIWELWDTYYSQVEWERWEQRLEDFENIDVLEFEKKDLIPYLKAKEKEWILISSWIFTVIWSMLARWINILK